LFLAALCPNNDLSESNTPWWEQDQIHHLKEAGIEACAFTGNADWMETSRMMDDIRSGMLNAKVCTFAVLSFQARNMLFFIIFFIACNVATKCRALIR